METSCREGYSEIGMGARRILLQKVWDDAMNLDLELDMLDFAERIGDKELIGGAYYRVMCSVYSSEHRGWKLDARRMAKLEHGKAQLISKWQEIFEDWGLQQF